MNIIYIDDNKINLYIVEKFLSMKHHVVCVENSKDFFNHFSNEKFDVALIDLNLNDPEIDGFGVFSNIKEKITDYKITCIAHSSYFGNEWEKRCIQAGFDYCIPKPFDIEIFENYLKNI